jgi:DNA-binding beta-propeller fold protein YncE
MKTLLALAFIPAVGCGGGQTPEPFGVPITGGTLLVTSDGARAVVADPDRDRIVAVELATGKVLGELTLNPNDEPGRLVEDAAGRVHVALRRGGAIVTVDRAAQQLDRRPACAEPRGLAFDASADTIHVACAGGELVTFAAAGGAPVRELRLDRDLRDVIVQNDQLLVTRFRTAEILTLDRDGNIVNRVSPPTVERFDFGFGTFPAEDGGRPGSGVIDAEASIAWRTIALADGSIVMSHQRKVKAMLDTEVPGGYGGDCGGGPVEDGITFMAPGQAPRAVGQIARAALPVDIAVSKAGDKIAVVAAGNRTVKVVPAAALGAPDEDRCEPPPPPCDGPIPEPFPDQPTDGGGGTDTPVPFSFTSECCRDDNRDGRCDDGDDEDDAARLGPPTSVAFAPNGDLVIFYPEANALIVRTQAGPLAHKIALPGSRANDAGRNVFHAQTRIGLACASCHPEGREDGLVWNFAQFGPRRTQSLGGSLLERAPFHWIGDMRDLNHLMDDVFANRMSGGFLTQSQKTALGPWLDRIPAPAPRTVDQSAAARGKAIYDDPSVGCLGCHNGALLTNNQLVNVGTGGKFKTPSLLGVGDRAPFMHDGCAQTLMDRFTTCGNSNLHGNTSHLTSSQLADLVEYLESL